MEDWRWIMRIKIYIWRIFSAREFIPGFSGVCVARPLVFCVCFVDRCFVLFLLVIVLSVLRFTASDYSFGICKHFFIYIFLRATLKKNIGLMNFDSLLSLIVLYFWGFLKAVQTWLDCVFYYWIYLKPLVLNCEIMHVQAPHILQIQTRSMLSVSLEALCFSANTKPRIMILYSLILLFCSII